MQTKIKAKLLYIHQEAGGWWAYEIGVAGLNNNIIGHTKAKDAAEIVERVEGFIKEQNGEGSRPDWQEYLRDEAIDQETRIILQELGL